MPQKPTDTLKSVKDCKYPLQSVLLQADEYGKGSIYGNLIEDKRVRDRLDNLVKSILKNWKRKR